MRLVEYKAIRCISCGNLLSKQVEATRFDACRRCGRTVRIDGRTIDWTNGDEKGHVVRSFLLRVRRAVRDGTIFVKLWVAFGAPTRLVYRLVTKRLQERSLRVRELYYKRILKRDNAMSSFWATHYLGHLADVRGLHALDFGCGRGRNLSHLRNIGCLVSALDVYRDPWWRNFPDVRFDVVPRGNVNLPYPDGHFGLVVCNGVLGFFDVSQRITLFAEFARVLAVKGTIVLIESNPRSYAGRAMKAYYGKAPPSVEEIKAVAPVNFRPIAEWYEGYYAKFLPMTRNLVFAASQREPGTWMIVDPRTRRLQPGSRGLWVLKMERCGEGKD